MNATVLYESELGRASAEFSPRRVYVHVRIRRWGMDAMRELRLYWPIIKANMKALGYDALHAYNYERDADAKWFKFMSALGFREVRRGRGLIVMEVSNA